MESACSSADAQTAGVALEDDDDWAAFERPDARAFDQIL